VDLFGFVAGWLILVGWLSCWSVGLLIRGFVSGLLVGGAVNRLVSLKFSSCTLQASNDVSFATVLASSAAL
jgi:hypothetical protein